MTYTNWHTSGRANQAKTEPVNLQSVYWHEHFSNKPLQITFNSRKDDTERILFCTIQFDKEEAKRIYELLKKQFS